MQLVKTVFVCSRYWVIEMHVDGFRFDLASIMTRASRLASLENCHDELYYFSFYECHD